MDKKTLMYGAAGLAAFWYFVLRKSTNSDTPSMFTRTPSVPGTVTNTGVGTPIVLITKPPDQVANNPVNAGENPGVAKTTTKPVAADPTPSFGSDNPNFDTSYRSDDEYMREQAAISKAAMAVMGY